MPRPALAGLVVSCRCYCPSMAWWISMPSKAACRKISPRRRRRSLGSKRLDNPNFADKAPAAVVAECRANLAEAETQAQLARKRLADLTDQATLSLRIALSSGSWGLG